MKYPRPKCQRCDRNRSEQETLCSDCQIASLIATLNKQKLENIHRLLREGHTITAIKEAREQFYLDLTEAKALVLFLQKDNQANT